ncbi:protein kinase [Bacillus subtilis subsp. subtilis]|nr:protein kinase [Bacillus subtilis subsp. subtilis]
MQEDTASVVELVTAFRQGTLDLPAVLAALARQPSVAEADYRQGVDTVWQMREEHAIDEAAMTTLLEHLQALRARAVDAPPSAEDITVVKPALGQAPEAGTDTRTHGTGTGTQSHSASLATWERVAAVEGQHVSVGSLLKGRFLLERELGRGGMGVVYLARDARKVEARDRDPWLAVKVLSDEFRRHPDALVALQREARRSQQLGHDNIVRVYDFDKDGGIVFMTMEYVAGSDLRTLIREQAFSGMPLARAWPLIHGMAQALRRAHAAGIVHSDFKPGNVMVTAEGEPKVFDFGIARAGKHAADVAGEQTVFDAASLGALTPAYASLEMLRGQSPTPGDDVYALGCVCFELLGGKHPFDKQSAEVALRDRLQPPPLPGLDRRQYRTLCAAVALEAGKRLTDVDALVQGLRPRGWRERIVPRLAYATAAVVVLATAGVLVTRHVHDQRLVDVTARLGSDDPQRYQDAAQAWAGIAGLDHAQRARLLLDHPDRIEAFLLRRLDALWAPAAGRFDYPATAEVFALRDRLRLYSPALDTQRARIQAERDQALNALDTQRQQALAQGRLFADGRDGLPASLAAIAAIDPDSALLRDPDVERAYETAVADALDSGQTTQAAARLQVAQRLFPAALGLRLQAAQLRMRAAPAVMAATAAAPTTPADAEQRLQALLEQPSADPQWQADVATALAALGRLAPAQQQAAQQRLATAVAAVLATARTPEQLPDDLVLLDFARRNAPANGTLAAAAEQVQHRQVAVRTALEADRDAAAMAAQTESLKRAVAAGDLDKAQRAWQQLHLRQPDNAFVREQAPALLEQAWQAKANQRLAQGDAAAADAVLARGLQVMGTRAALQTARTRLQVAAAVLAASTMPALKDSERERLRQQLDVQYRRDPRAMAELERSLRASGRLKAESLQALLQAGASGTAVAVPAAAPAPTAAPASAGARARPTPAASATSRPLPAGDDDTLPPLPEGPDPCDGLAGRAQPCFDALGPARGPMLVVVPGIGGGRPFALSRGEVAVDDFNRYCSASGRCTPHPVGSAEQGRLPVRNISLAQAQGYARWLTHASGGWRYRLPTDAEWLHAAQAQQQWKQSPDSNCVAPGASAGNGAPVGVRGREANPWGLVNLSGNVWEWVAGGGVRGGSYASFWSDCTVQARRDAGATGQPDIGLRVLRELR